MNPKSIFKLRSILLSPNSKLELWLRTQYHRLNKTRLFFWIQDWMAKRSYRRWRAEQSKQLLKEDAAFEQEPKVSFLLSCPPDKNHALLTTLESIKSLKRDNWEVILLNSEKGNYTDLPDEISQDPRISIFASKSKRFIESTNGDFVLVCEAGDLFFQGLLKSFYKTLSEDPSANWYFYDCEYYDLESNKTRPLFKTPTYSPSLLLSLNYLSRGFIRKSFLHEKLTPFNLDTNLLNQEYDIALQLTGTEGSIKHIPQMLIRQTSLVLPNTPERQAIITSHLSHQGLESVSARSKTYGTRFSWHHPEPSVAIIIPTRNNWSLLEPCLSSLFSKTTYKNFTVHLVDNDSKDNDTLAYYQQIRSKQKINIHSYTEDFNYSQANNLGVAKSDSDLVLLLNDDIEIYDSEWLTELVQWAIRPEIGVVGAKLIRANHTIQHAGIIIGLNGFAGHVYLNAPEHYRGLFGSLDWYRDYLAVTGACQMMRREVFDQVGGFDEGYKLAFGDIDFCLRVRDLGYRIIYTPFASLFHYEGRSRGYSTPNEDILRGYTQMKSALSYEDPYFSPNLTYTRIPKCDVKGRSKKDREDQIKTRRKFNS